MEEKEIEELEVEELDVDENKEKEEKQDKVEIVEHVESKYDDLKPRTEMADLSKEEKKEIKEKVIKGFERKEKKSESKEKNNTAVQVKLEKKKGNVGIIILIIIGIIIGLYWLAWPIIKSSINTQWKPIIYIYPTEDTDVTIKVSNPDDLTTTYPKYNNEWKVKALTDGTLIDSNNRKYYALYWESENNKKNPIKEDGFIVKGEDSASFLEEKLEILGLNYKERNEFIMYWLPKLESNKYNYIRFQTMDEINDDMGLDINPKPDTLIRVRMEYTGLDKKIKVKEQSLTKVERHGYTVVEWGGTNINR